VVVFYAREAHFQFDPDTRRLFRQGRPWPVDQPLPDHELRLLGYFVQHPKETLRREQLEKAVWGRLMAPATVDRAVYVLRAALGDSADEQCFIETVRQTKSQREHGYRFVAEFLSPSVPDHNEGKEEPPPTANPGSKESHVHIASHHGRYTNNGAVGLMYSAFPKLIRRYGRITRFEFFLIEHRTVEDEGRVDALADGVILDLAPYLLALVQLLFLDFPHPALAEPDLELNSVGIRVNKVARARYTRCQIENADAETFAAIDVILTVRYAGRRREIVREVLGLMAVGKGIRPSSNVCADLKGLRFEQELHTRCVNLARNEVNPPLADLDYYGDDRFSGTIADALDNEKAHKYAGGEQNPHFVSVEQARVLAEVLKTVIRASSNLQFYRAGDTLDSVIAQSAADGSLDPQWLRRSNYVEIGYA
jgi:DNA-binding winged helix-turn-helix (wHTH) protein